MDSCVKHRIVGSILVITIVLVISPLFLKETKPAWMVKEDERSLRIPKPPKLIELAALDPKDKWTMPANAIKIITDNKPAKNIEIAQLAFSEQQSLLSSKTKQAIIEEQVAGFAQNEVKKLIKAKGNKKDFPNLNLPNDVSHFSLQLATFANEDLAKQLLKKLEAQSIEGELITRGSTSGKEFFMVRTSKMSELREIKQLQLKLDKTLNIHSLIIKNISLSKGSMK